MKAQARALFAAGHTAAEVARMVKAPRATVCAWAAKGKWSSDRSAALAQSERNQDDSGKIVETSRNIGLEIAALGEKYRHAAARYSAKVLDHAAEVAETDPVAGLAIARPVKDVHAVARDVYDIGTPDTVVQLGFLADHETGSSALSGAPGDKPDGQTIDV